MKTSGLTFLALLLFLIMPCIDEGLRKFIMNRQADPNSDSYRRQMRRLRITILIWGILAFIWLAPEDDSVLPALLLGLGLSALVITWLFIRLKIAAWMRAWRTLLVAAVFGALIGAGTSLSTVLLLLIKNARHAHLTPDYPPEILLDTLERFPAWSLVGALIGIGLVCIYWGFHQQSK
jgi:hypothetical protein